MKYDQNRRLGALVKSVATSASRVGRSANSRIFMQHQLPRDVIRAEEKIIQAQKLLLGAHAILQDYQDLVLFDDKIENYTRLAIDRSRGSRERIKKAEYRNTVNTEYDILQQESNSMGYMSVDRKDLIQDLRQCVAEIRFQKMDGTQRVLIGTLQKGYLPEEYQGQITEQANHDPNPDVLAVWDVENKGWRSFRLDQVFSVQMVDR